MPNEQVASFGREVPMERPDQPAELAPPYVMLASDEANSISDAGVAATGGSPMP